jgi:hypothetical protein
MPSTSVHLTGQISRTKQNPDSQFSRQGKGNSKGQSVAAVCKHLHPDDEESMVFHRIFDFARLKPWVYRGMAWLSGRQGGGEGGFFLISR